MSKQNKAQYKKNLKRQRFNKQIEIFTDFFDNHYPGWQKGKDADYIKKKINTTAKNICNNRLRKKTKLLYKKDFKNWPFRVDQIILVQTSKLWISCMVKNKNGIHEYALNGLAITGLKLKTVHEAGIARKGESIGEFIQIGLKL